ncbi:glycoside hydrolase superfamily [Fennellomyces sp. T-0311]|nr:glycoside hydrolase superfamily [Fennellomyces sp. T-0311]
MVKFLSLLSSALLVAPSLISAAFVDTSGTSFTLGDSSFAFAGTNAYYLMTSDQSDVDTLFSTVSKAQLPVVRTWLFNMGTDSVWFQQWDAESGTMKINDDAETGLGRMDYVLQQAAANDVKVILTLTNNWADFGGMDYYVKSFGGKYHDDFYTNKDIIGSFKSYIEHVANRTNELTGTKYSEDETIFAWEIANEPRCVGSGTYPTSDSCGTDVTTAWIDEISTHIKSVDSNHLVAVGDEGFFNHAGEDDYEYNGGTGMDFDASLALPNIDFGTFHLYVSDWSKTNEWGTQWVKDHADAQASAKKPVLFEEYGVEEAEERTTVYPEWQAIVEEGLAADTFWQIAVPCNPDLDKFAICADDANWDTIIGNHAAAMAAKVIFTSSS